MGLFDKLKGAIGGLFTAGTKLDDEFYEELEEALIVADVGVTTAEELVRELRTKCKKEGIRDAENAKEVLRGIMRDILERPGDRSLKIGTKPSVILVIGVNGVGKTTTIGKMAHYFVKRKKRVLLCAADTFRAAAADQLEIWAGRAKAEIVRQNEGADPAAVLFDAISAAKARGTDIILCDTAGRLHNKQNLMNELSKISRIIDREIPGADKETLLVLDATTGQNGLSQVKSFTESIGLTGLVITKLDGTAKGGFVLGVSEALSAPVKYIGVGERVEDLLEFDPGRFVGDIIV